MHTDRDPEQKSQYALWSIKYQRLIRERYTHTQKAEYALGKEKEKKKKEKIRNSTCRKSIIETSIRTIAKYKTKNSQNHQIFSKIARS